MNELQSITYDMLVYKGAECEILENAIEAILPKSLSEKLELDEFSKFYFENSSNDDGLSISYESDWLDKFLDLLGSQKGRVCYIEPIVQPSRKIPDIEKLLSKELIFDNAIYRVKNAQESFANYSVLLLKGIAISDEKKEALHFLPINESNFLFADHLVQYLFESWESNGYSNYTKIESEFLSSSQLLSIYTPMIEGRLKSTFSSFIATMERRIARDIERVYQYYHDIQMQLKNKAFQKYKKSKENFDSTLEKQKLISIEREYIGKLSDLEKKYHLKLDTEAIQLLKTRLPVYRIEIEIHRRKNIRKLNLDYNYLTKKLDNVYCEKCFGYGKNYSVDDISLKFSGHGCNCK